MRKPVQSTLALLVVLSAVLLVADAVPQAADPGALLRAAIEKEEVDGDLNAAIAQYKQIIANNGNNRAVAANALLRLAGCYEKLGQEDARKVYETVIRDYGDQREYASKARERLAALRAGSTQTVRQSRMAIRRVPKFDMYAKPSPDGKYLAFVDWTAGNLAIQDLATGSTRLLTKDGAWGDNSRYAEFSAWSRDSKRIAFTWTVSGVKENRSELRIVSLSGEAAPRAIPIPCERGIIPLDWSPDGSRILCACSGLALINAGNGEVEKLGVDLSPPLWFEFRFTEDGDSILYSYPTGGTGTAQDIYQRNLKTGATKAIVEHPSVDLLVGILPGSEWLLFASNRRGSLDLWGVPFREGKTGGPAVLVKQGIGRFFPSGFTNDGRYYYSTLSVTDDVFFVDFDRKTGKVSGEPRKLATQWEGTNMGAAFSPDGEKLAYVTKRGALPIPTHVADTLVIQSLKDTNLDPVPVSFDEFRLNRVGDPCWADNGKAIVLRGVRGPESGLYRVDLPDLRKSRIISAPEGRRITYHDCHAGSNSVYFVLGPEVLRIGSDGANERTLYRAPNGQRVDTLAVSPDGGTLSLVTRVDNYRRALLLMPAGGGTPRQIHGFTQSTGGWVSHAWAPDGKSIFYVVQKPERRGWLLQRVSVEGAEVSEQMLEWPNPFYSPKFHPKGHLLAFTGRSGASTASELWVIENLKQELDSLVSTSKVR